MKYLLPYLIFFIIAVSSVQAQTTIYLDDNLSAVTDSTKAGSKVILKKYADDTTLWAISQYTLKNKLLVQGVYKDREMQIPHGDFKYYYLRDTTYYLKKTGGFFNGAKFGEWIEYYPDGKKMMVANYRNNILNGPYEVYNKWETDPVTKGSYLKGIKDGVWIMPGGVTKTYKDGVVIETTGEVDPEEARQRVKKEQNFKDARQPSSFDHYVQEKFGFYFNSLQPSNAIRRLVVEFTVDEHGKLSYKSVRADLSNNFINKIIDLLNQAPQWEPATANGKPVSENINYTIIELKTPYTYKNN
jgi:antitoxin component YwqK of YwqJK toxin-antitoxin module